MTATHELVVPRSIPMTSLAAPFALHPEQVPTCQGQLAAHWLAHWLAHWKADPVHPTEQLQRQDCQLDETAAVHPRYRTMYNPEGQYIESKWCDPVMRQLMSAAPFLAGCMGGSVTIIKDEIGLNFPHTLYCPKI